MPLDNIWQLSVSKKVLIFNTISIFFQQFFGTLYLNNFNLFDGLLRRRRCCSYQLATSNRRPECTFLTGHVFLQQPLYSFHFVYHPISSFEILLFTFFLRIFYLLKSIIFSFDSYLLFSILFSRFWLLLASFERYR